MGKPQKAIICSTGQMVTLAPRKESGFKPCPGEAHSNAYIDHCMVCLNPPHRWGQVMSYEPLTPDACAAGFAVPVGHGDQDLFEAAEKEGRVTMVNIEQKIGRNSSVSFCAYIAKEV